MTTTTETYRLSGIELSPAGIKAVTGNLATLVKTADVTDITVRYGFRSAHPIIQLVLGAGLTFVLLHATYRFLFWSDESDGTMLGAEFRIATFGIVGVWLLFDALSRGHYLIINTTRGQRKICFNKKTELTAVNDFCQLLRDKKFKVHSDLLV